MLMAEPGTCPIHASYGELNLRRHIASFACQRIHLLMEVLLLTASLAEN